MPTHLRVTAGTSVDTMVPITSLVNTGRAHAFKSDVFEGEVVAYIKGLEDGVPDSEYFHREERAGVTWSIQVRGRFLTPYSANNILFGNTFDRPLKLPWGTGAVLKFMHYIDPTLEHDLQSTNKPWALSPLVSTMPYFAHTRLEDSRPASPEHPNGTHSIENAKSFPSIPPAHSITEDTSQLYMASTDHSSGSSSFEGSGSDVSSIDSGGSVGSHSSSKKAGSATSGSARLKNAVKKRLGRPKRKPRSQNGDEGMCFEDGTERRSYFSYVKNREDVVFGPLDLITTDFCYGFINFNPALSLQLPGGLSFDLEKYWDGQPVRFVCCERQSESGGDEPWGRIFWCVAIEVVDES